MADEVMEIDGAGKLYGGDRNSRTTPINAGEFERIQAECLESGELFEDADFPANDETAFYSGKKGEYEWLRPREIVDDPKFISEGADRFDVKQGELGDCWMLAGVAALTMHENYFYHVVPHGNSFEEGEYCGAFHFRFWQYGKWVEVIVDDRLPTRNGHLVFMHSGDGNEFWSALLEKAYAKLHGSYEALEGGHTSEALSDFTGGITEKYQMSEVPENLYQILEKAFSRGYFMGCAKNGGMEDRTEEGLVTGHAYSITCVRQVEIEDHGMYPLLRIRNPWGNNVEWNGAWSDGSEEWGYVSEEQREELGLTFDHDGEFWMSYDDFVEFWDDVEICNLSVEGFGGEVDEVDQSRTWIENHFEGDWIPGVTAGGCINNPSYFACNPQYKIKLDDPDEGDDEEACSVLISLMQKHRRANSKFGVKSLSIGFSLYEMKDDVQETPLTVDFFRYNRKVGGSGTFINLREVSNRLKVTPGMYAIVPSTFSANEEGEFFLRVFTETKAELVEYDGEVGMVNEIETSEEEMGQSEKIKEIFKEGVGEDGEVDWNGLKNMLDAGLKEEFQFEGFSRDVCRSMVALMDKDMSGKLGLEEFVKLFKSVKSWANVFKLYDKDESNYLDSFELRHALNSAGYTVNKTVLQALVLRYGDADGKIHFDDFIMCAVKLKAMIENFNENLEDEDKDKASFTLNEWIKKTLYS